MLNRLIAAGVLVAAMPGMAIAGTSSCQIVVPTAGAGLTLGVAVVALYLFKKLRG